MTPDQLLDMREAAEAAMRAYKFDWPYAEHINIVRGREACEHVATASPANVLALLDGLQAREDQVEAMRKDLARARARLDHRRTEIAAQALVTGLARDKDHTEVAARIVAALDQGDPSRELALALRAVMTWRKLVSEQPRALIGGDDPESVARSLFQGAIWDDAQNALDCVANAEPPEMPR